MITQIRVKSGFLVLNGGAIILIGMTDEDQKWKKKLNKVVMK